MTIFASKSKRAFYDSSLFSTVMLPVDAVQIDDSLHAACLQAMAINWDGEVPAPTDQAHPNPDVKLVTMRQARLALLAEGLLDDVDAAIAAISDEQQRAAAQIEWQFASTVEKDSPLIQSLAPAIGLDDEALTALFNTARSL